MAADASCVFHGDDRYVFNALVLSLRKLGLVTREHAQVMAMTVCTCRKKGGYLRPGLATLCVCVVVVVVVVRACVCVCVCSFDPAHDSRQYKDGAVG